MEQCWYEQKPAFLGLSISFSLSPSLPLSSCPFIIQLYITFHPASPCIRGERQNWTKFCFYLISLSLFLLLSLLIRPPACPSPSSSVLILILLFIVLLSDSVFNNLMGEGFVCVMSFGVTFISQTLEYCLTECSGKGRYTLPHTGCSAHQWKDERLKGERGRDKQCFCLLV